MRVRVAKQRAGGKSQLAFHSGIGSIVWVGLEYFCQDLHTLRDRWGRIGRSWRLRNIADAETTEEWNGSWTSECGNDGLFELSGLNKIL